MTNTITELYPGTSPNRNDPKVGSPACRAKAIALSRAEVIEALNFFNPFINWTKREEIHLRRQLVMYLYTHAGETNCPASDIHDT